MLWYKTWLETRWRFVIGLGLLAVSAASTVMSYPKVLELLPLVPDVDLGGEIGRQVRESVALSREYRGYVWSQWFVQNLSQLWVLFAALLGTGGLLAQGSGGGTLFTLALPLTRHRVFTVRAATGLLELLALALVPSLLIPVLSPAIGQSYGVGAALIHGGCMFVAGSLFFGLALLLSTVFGDAWRPWLIVLCAAVVLGLLERLTPALPYGVFHVMSAESYFRRGELPWLGLLATASVSVAVLVAAAANIARRDF